MVDKVEADVPNDDDEGISAEEQEALNDRSTVGQAKREEEKAVIGADEPAKEAKPKTEAKAEKPEDEKEGKHVPLATLIEERREFQRKMEDRERRDAERDAKLELMARRFTMPQQEPPKAPSWDEDPLAAGKTLDQRVAQMEQQTQRQNQEQQFIRHVATVTSQYAATVPDYKDAYTHAVTTRVAELRALGCPENQIATTIQRDELMIAQQALQQGKNPGELIYAYANARGYKKAEAQAEKPEQSATEKLETIERGQTAARSLSGNGAAPAAKLTLKDLDSISEDQIANMDEKTFRALFGH